jgi:hypothetical protein
MNKNEILTHLQSGEWLREDGKIYTFTSEVDPDFAPDLIGEAYRINGSKGKTRYLVYLKDGQAFLRIGEFEKYLIQHISLDSGRLELRYEKTQDILVLRLNK